MATNEPTTEATTEARQKAMDEATTDKLDDTSPPLSPETESPDAPEYRADVAMGKWQPTPSPWRKYDSVFLRLRDGRTAGPFTIIALQPPKNEAERWRYDVQDGTGKIKKNISGSILV